MKRMIGRDVIGRSEIIRLVGATCSSSASQATRMLR
jgi:hypothetical protein